MKKRLYNKKWKKQKKVAEKRRDSYKFKGSKFNENKKQTVHTKGYTRSDIFRLIKDLIWDEPDKEKYILGDSDMLEIGYLANMLQLSGERGVDFKEKEFFINLGTFMSNKDNSRHRTSGSYYAFVFDTGEQVELQFIARHPDEDMIITDPQIKMELVNKWVRM